MTIVDRAYGSLLGSVIGSKMGQPALFLTPNQVRWYYDSIEEYIDPDPDLKDFQDACREGSGLDDLEEMMILAESLIKNRQFAADLFAEDMKAWCEEKDLLNNPVLEDDLRAYLEAVMLGSPVSPAAPEAVSSGSLLRTVPVGIRHYYDPDQSMEEALKVMGVSHGSRPASGAACALSVGIGACFNEEYDLNMIMECAADAAIQGERTAEEICMPSVSRRIRQAKKIADAAKSNGMNYIIDELTGLFGAGNTAYESVPLALGIFYAAEGDPVKAIPAIVGAGGAASVNAAICGALCGAYAGVKGFPKEWMRPAMKATGRNLKSIGMDLIRRI